MRRTTAAAVAVTLAAAGSTGAVGPRPGLAAAAVSSRAALVDCSGAITGSSNPADLTDADGTLFFTAFDNHHRPSLWSTDGTATGTVRLDDLSGEERRYESYSTLEPVGHTMFFTADGFTADGALSGTDLMRSDGTKAGTELVKHFRGFGEMAAVGDELFFDARDRNGPALRRTDGTKAGTSLVAELPDPDVGDPGVRDLTAVGDRVYFRMDDGVHGSELWTSDGTAAGTVLVKDIAPGGSGSTPGSLTAAGDRLFFWADDHVHGRELWVSDGTEDGTVLVHDVGAGDFGSETYSQVAVGDTLFFSAVGDDDALVDLWRSDGTTEGTVVVKQMGARPYYDEERFDLATAGGLVFFGPNDATHGREMWRTDGTEDGTVLVKDIGLDPSGSNPQGFTAVGDEIFFLASGELWRSDGTEDGTEPVPGVTTSRYARPYGLTASGDRAYFVNDDGVHDDEVWVSDGTGAGTHLTRDINRVVDWRVSSRPQVNPRNTAVRVKATFDSPGRLSAAPALTGGIRAFSQRISGDPTIRVGLTLRLTRAASRRLRHHGHVRVGVEYTFMTCTGQVNSYRVSYYLRKQ